jgi:hypothetical protein
MQLALMLAKQCAPDMVTGISGDMQRLLGGKAPAGAVGAVSGGEVKHMRTAKARAAGSSRL